MDYAEFDSEHAPYDGLRKIFFKTSINCKNTSLPLMESLPLPMEASQSAILRKGRSTGVWSAPEFVCTGVQYPTNYSKISIFRMVELSNLPFWNTSKSNSSTKIGSADGLRREESFFHPQISSTPTRARARAGLEESIFFKKTTQSIHGAPSSRKKVRTSPHRRKTHGGLSVARDFWGSIERKLIRTWRFLDNIGSKIMFTFNKLKFEPFKVKFKDRFQLNANAKVFSPTQPNCLMEGSCPEAALSFLPTPTGAESSLLHFGLGSAPVGAVEECSGTEILSDLESSPPLLKSPLLLASTTELDDAFTSLCLQQDIPLLLLNFFDELSYSSQTQILSDQLSSDSDSETSINPSCIQLIQLEIRQPQVDVEPIESTNEQKNNYTNKDCGASEPQSHTRSKQLQQVVGSRSNKSIKSEIRQYQVDVEPIENTNNQNNISNKIKDNRQNNKRKKSNKNSDSDSEDKQLKIDSPVLSPISSHNSSHLPALTLDELAHRSSFLDKLRINPPTPSSDSSHNSPHLSSLTPDEIALLESFLDEFPDLSEYTQVAPSTNQHQSSQLTPAMNLATQVNTIAYEDNLNTYDCTVLAKIRHFEITILSIYIHYVTTF